MSTRTLPLVTVLLLVPFPARAQERLPIIDMHLHALAADSPPVVLCPPFENLPVWDPAEEYSWEVMLEAYTDPECENPLESAATGEGVMRETISAMQRHKVFGVLGGSPQFLSPRLVAEKGITMEDIPITSYK